MNAHIVIVLLIVSSLIQFVWALFTETSIFTVEGVHLYPEPNRQSK